MRLLDFLLCLSLSVDLYLGSPELLRKNIEVSLLKANCTTVTVAARCPSSPENMNMTLALMRVTRSNAAVVASDWIVCEANSSDFVRALFTLACKSLYQVNLSLDPSSFTYSSPKWWLGAGTCVTDTSDDCPLDQYRSPLNMCPESSQPCTSLNRATERSTSKTLSTWSPKLSMVMANCSSLTVKAFCPTLTERTNLTFVLIHPRRDVSISTNTMKCTPNSSVTIYTTFLIDCQSYYQVNISLNKGQSVRDCDSSCTRVHQSSVWVLGSKSCGRDEFTKCISEDLLSELNHCSSVLVKCSGGWTFSVGLIILTVVLVLFVLVSISIALRFMGTCAKKPFAYHRTNDEVLIFQSDEV